jgi:hypothetical protein
MVDPISSVDSNCHHHHRCYITGVSATSSGENDATTSPLELSCSVCGLSILRSTFARIKGNSPAAAAYPARMFLLRIAISLAS